MESDQKKSNHPKKRFKRTRRIMILLLLLLAVSQAVSLGLLAVCEEESREQVRQELVGLEYLESLHRLQDLLPAYSGGIPGRDGASRETLALKEQEIDDVLHRLDRIDQFHGAALDTTEDLVHLEDLWKQCRKAAQQSDAQAALERQLDAGIRSLVALVGDTSHLMLDPRLDTYYLIDSLVNRLGQGEETLADARRLQREDGGMAGEKELALLSRELRRNLQETSRNYQVSLEKEEIARSRLEKPLRSYEARLVSLIDFVDRSSRPGGPEPGNFTQLVNAALAANSRLFVRTLPEVRRLLEERREELERRRTRRLASVLPFLVIGLGLAAWGLRAGAGPAEAREGPAPGDLPTAPPAADLQDENEQLKLLVAELALANRSLRRHPPNSVP
jgi:hypothetical protein